MRFHQRRISALPLPSRLGRCPAARSNSTPESNEAQARDARLEAFKGSCGHVSLLLQHFTALSGMPPVAGMPIAIAFRRWAKESLGKPARNFPRAPESAAPERAIADRRARESVPTPSGLLSDLDFTGGHLPFRSVGTVGLEIPGVKGAPAPRGGVTL